MNTAAHLLPEDRPEFERAVDEALRDAATRPALAAAGERISAQRLRVMALSTATSIAAQAAEEYGRYVALRTRLREGAVGAPSPLSPQSPSPSAPEASASSPSSPYPAGSGARTGGDGRPADGERRGGTGGLSLAGVGEGVNETTGAGLLAMVSVLVPLLAGTAAVIFLLIGNLLRVVSPEPSIAAPMRGAGWIFAVLAAAGIVVVMAELWLTALRHGAGARRSGQGEAAGRGGAGGAAAESALAGEVSAARAAWREALLERGIVPFLAEALEELPPAGELQGGMGGPGVDSRGMGGPGLDSRGTDSRGMDGRSREGVGGPAGGGGSAAPPAGSAGGAGAAPAREAASEAVRTPRLGYSGPDFSSRSPSDGEEQDSLRPRYSSPDYSSPDYGGPEHKPE